MLLYFSLMILKFALHSAASLSFFFFLENTAFKIQVDIPELSWFEVSKAEKCCLLEIFRDIWKAATWKY